MRRSVQQDAVRLLSYRNRVESTRGCKVPYLFYIRLVDIEPGKAAELRVKHLEMLQSVISRMAGQGATLKNYCITLTTAVCGLAITLERPLANLLALLVVTIFALLDAQYLRLERRFRSMYERVRLENWSARPSFEISLTNMPKGSYWAAGQLVDFRFLRAPRRRDRNRGAHC